MHPYEALYFDFSGTLLNESADRQAHIELIQSFLNEYGVQGDPEKLCAAYENHVFSLYRRTIDPNYFISIANLHAEALRLLVIEDMGDGAELSAQKFDIERFEHRSDELHILHSRLLPGARDALKVGREMGMHIGIISDYDDLPLNTMLMKLDLVDLLDSITSSEEVGVYKPAQEIFLSGLSKSGCDAVKAIYIGDRWERDVVGAKNVGMVSVLIGSDSHGNPPPDFLIEDISALPELLNQIRDS